MTMHPCHARRPLLAVLREGSYPFPVATGPIKRYVKARLGRGTSDAGLAEALRRTAATAAHCYPRQNDVIWATVQRAGHNWVSLIYTLVAERVFQQREVGVENIARARAGLYRHLPIRYDLGDHETRFRYDLPVPRLMHTHDPHYPWMDHRRILLQVRQPEDVLTSKYFHGGFYPDTPFAAYLKSSTAAGLVHFYNTWGAALAQKRLSAVYVLKYEAVKSDPVAEMQRVFTFLGLPAVAASVIEQALERTTHEHLQRLEQQGKSLGDESLAQNVKSTRPPGGLPANDQAALRAFLQEKLVYDFGYGGQAR